MSKDIEGSIDSEKKKIRKKVKKICCCGIWWFLTGLLFLIVAIALLVHFSKYWGDSSAWQRGLAYTGLALLLIGAILAAIGIVFFVILRCVYKRVTSDHTYRPAFKPPQYAYGQAPYPQQPPSSAVYSQLSTGTTGPSSGSNTVVPSAPPAGEKPASPGGAHVEVTEHTKF